MLRWQLAAALVLFGILHAAQIVSVTADACGYYAFKPADAELVLYHVNVAYGTDKDAWPSALEHALTDPYSNSVILAPDASALQKFASRYDLSALSDEDVAYIQRVLAAHIAVDTERPLIGSPNADFDAPLEFQSLAGSAFRIEKGDGDLYVTYSVGDRDMSVAVTGAPQPPLAQWNAAARCGGAWVIPIADVIEPDFPHCREGGSSGAYGDAPDGCGHWGGYGDGGSPGTYGGVPSPGGDGPSPGGDEPSPGSDGPANGGGEGGSQPPPGGDGVGDGDGDEPSPGAPGGSPGGGDDPVSNTPPSPGEPGSGGGEDPVAPSPGGATPGSPGGQEPGNPGETPGSPGETPGSPGETPGSPGESPGGGDGDGGGDGTPPGPPTDTETGGGNDNVQGPPPGGDGGGQSPAVVLIAAGVAAALVATAGVAATLVKRRFFPGSTAGGGAGPDAPSGAVPSEASTVPV